MKIRARTASLLFILLTVIKLTNPQITEDIKQFLFPRSRPEQSIAESAAALGCILSGGGEALRVSESRRQQTEAVFERHDVEGFELEAMVEKNLLSFSMSNAPEQEQAPAAPEVLTAETTESTVENSRDLETLTVSFLQSQGKYEGYALPESVWSEAVYLDFDFCRPVSGGAASGFGYRVHPIYGDVRFHYGTDMSANQGDTIYAFLSGTVVAAQEFDGYGLTVIIDHQNGFSSLYAHCSRLDVAYGDTVNRGDAIALVGSTGNVTGPHLHFELQKDGKYLNPEFYL